MTRIIAGMESQASHREAPQHYSRNPANSDQTEHDDTMQNKCSDRPINTCLVQPSEGGIYGQTSCSEKHMEKSNLGLDVLKRREEMETTKFA